jgi:putative hydrolase of the HAD superfamily
MTIRATIWDFSGVLIQPRIPNPHDVLAAELGITPQQLAKYFDGRENHSIDTGLETEHDYIQRMLRELGLSPDSFHLISNFFFDKFELDQEFMTFIRQSRPQMLTALCSNFSDRLRPSLQEPWGILNDFDAIIISCEVGSTKPKPEIYQITLQQLNVAPEEAVFIDDLEENVKGAQALGMQGIWFKDTRDTLQQIQQYMLE